MNDEAAHIVDNVLPEVATRQWVLSFPYKLRYQMAHNSKLTNKILSIFAQSIALYQKKKAKKLGIKNSKSGSVTFIQRFGSALNLNVHFHSLFAAGVFYKVGDGFYEFFRLPEPTQDELAIIARQIQEKVFRFTKKFEEQDQPAFDEGSLTDIAAMSISHKAGFGERFGQGLRRYGTKRIEVDVDSSDPYSVNVGGFSLNAKVWVGGRDREKLEKLIRYMARGPIATERLTESFPNQLLYKMKTPWRDGTTSVSFSPLDFIARLVALVPPAKMNLVRYHGVFAPNFKDRSLVVQKKATTPKRSSVESAIPAANKACRERMRWSEMLKRTFKIDVTVCSHCGGRLEQIAVIKDRVAIKAILESLKETTVFNPLKVVRERGPPGPSAIWKDEFDQRESW
jgi:hypothetical protein